MVLKQLIIFWMWVEFYSLQSFWTNNHASALGYEECIIFIISMFHLLSVPSFRNIGANSSVGTKFAQIYNFGSTSSVPSTIFITSMFESLGSLQFYFWNQICAILGQDPQFSNIIFKINELDLLWVPIFIALGIYFIFGTTFSWNE